MLGMFNLLSLLKGWQYKKHDYEKTLKPGEASLPWRIPDMGWLIGILSVTDDAYGATRIEYQDANLEIHTVEFRPETARILGMVQQDPVGWIPRYFRPNPNSTGGLYSLNIFTGGWQGAAWPFIPTTIMTLLLGAESNQASATISSQALTLVITNKSIFIQSLRQVLDSQADIRVPEELLSLGPTPLVQQPNKTDLLLEQILAELKQRR